jgi:hypothetical protein
VLEEIRVTSERKRLRETAFVRESGGVSARVLLIAVEIA